MTWRVQWRAAVSAASKNPKSLNLLARMIVGWGWKNELEELLWSIARGSSDQKWALQLLYRQYQKERDSRGLYRVVSQVLDIDPSDRVAKNNRALLGLLLNLEPILAFKSAQDLYRKDPKNPSFVSTYAFALHCRGQTAEGIRIMSALDRRQLQIPSVAAYYGILLANGGDVEKARKYLDLADQAPLLPEERALVTQARKAVNSP
jgi:Flp pilus assembly protein TadD